MESQTYNNNCSSNLDVLKGDTVATASELVSLGWPRIPFSLNGDAYGLVSGFDPGADFIYQFRPEFKNKT
jgi:hypothetical protein